jgi:hypothetical protein
MSSLPVSVEKYLEKFSSSNWSLEIAVNKLFNMTIVIPALSEYENIKKLLNSLLKNDSSYFSKTILLFVINNLVSSAGEVKTDNENSIKFLRLITQKKKGKDALADRILNSELNIGFVDAASKGRELSEKDGGVGLTRKIGMDLALTLFDYSNADKKILLCLDADCTVSANYISAVYESFNKQNISAAAINFEHPLSGSREEILAIINYEIFLRYYVLGLTYAKSLYAFYTIGSAMACDYESYIKIGGMNKQKAAEDFYFLEKLAKIVPIQNIKEATVYPAGRGSWRVPFGTGQRVNRYLSKTQDEYFLYSPKSFIVLKKWLEVFNKEDILTAKDYLNKAKDINNSLYGFLKEQNFEKDWNKILKNSSLLKQIQKQKKLWFDGFKTLKFVHYLRDNEFPLTPMFNAIDELLKEMNIPQINKCSNGMPPIEIQIEYLNKLRKLT